MKIFGHQTMTDSLPGRDVPHMMRRNGDFNTEVFWVRSRTDAISNISLNFASVEILASYLKRAETLYLAIDRKGQKQNKCN